MRDTANSSLTKTEQGFLQQKQNMDLSQRVMSESTRQKQWETLGIVKRFVQNDASQLRCVVAPRNIAQGQPGVKSKAVPRF